MNVVMPSEWVLASANAGKIEEFQSLFSPMGIKVRPQSFYAVEDVAETGTTFVENAIIKARHAAQVSGLPAIADDSGLAVDALYGAPGIYSARYAGEPRSDQNNIDKLLSDMHEHDNRRARFICVLVFMRSHLDPTPIICQGEWQGEIARQRSGTEGFGYDPVFWLPSENLSAAQLDKTTKNSISHRGAALRGLMRELSAQLSPQ